MRGYRAKKHLGQHFLNNKKDLISIVNAATLTKNDTVLEIGPGLGALTAELASRAGHVITIEKDKELCEALQKRFSNTKNVSIVAGDALRIDFSALSLIHNGFKVVANIPYYITSSILRKLLSKTPKPTLAALTVQKEVAHRIVAKPPHLSILALSVLFFGAPTLVMNIPKERFSPRPKVDSAIIAIKLLEHSPHHALESVFFKLVKAGFAQKRKTLANSLSSALGMPKNKAHALLESVSIPHNARAQEISFEAWIKLARSAQETAL